MNRYFIWLAYKGTNYCGWQRQPNGLSVQQCVEEVLETVLRHPVPLTGAGRTDAGVHATAQVLHFDTRAERSPFAWLAGTNRYLPTDIRLQWITAVADDFHARYSATARHYRYLIRHRAQPSALWAQRCHWHKKRRPTATASPQRDCSPERTGIKISSFIWNDDMPKAHHPMPNSTHTAALPRLTAP